MDKDKKMIIALPISLHTKLKVQAAKTKKTMNLLIVEALREILK
jgi:predicted HicB family RNase H-like nuclease